MPRKLPENIKLENMFDVLSSHFEATYEELQNVLREEANYKRLLKIGEKQFFDAPSESSIEVESQKSRLCFAKINLLAVEVDNDIDRIIQEKLQGDFLNKFKDEVLNAVLELSSKQKNSTQVLVPVSPSQVEQKKNEDKVVLEKIKDLSKYFAQNTNDIRKQVNEMPVEETESSAAEKNEKTHSNVVKKEELDKDNSDLDLGNISFGSVSSVHTSDLSSFDDEIVLSSDEELGVKGKKMMLKAVQEKLEQVKAERLENTKDDPQVKNSQLEDNLQSKNPPNESHISQKSQRERRPNLKYATDDIVSPFKRKSIEKISSHISDTSSSTEGDTDVPRKRGRPRKHLT